MAPIKPIETFYKGYRFRSRLEARWAVFFDAIGADWEYEPEGFVLENGMYYLPDFLIHNNKGRGPCELWIEVKSPYNYSREEQDKIEAFANPAYMGEVFSDTRAILVVGNIPDCETYDSLICGIDYDEDRKMFSLEIIDGDYFPAIPSKYNLGGFCLNDGNSNYGEYVDKQGTLYAYKLARQARFEHGETPAVYNPSHDKNDIFDIF